MLNFRDASLKVSNRSLVTTNVWPLGVFRDSLCGRSRVSCCVMEQLLFWSQRRLSEAALVLRHENLPHPFTSVLFRGNCHFLLVCRNRARFARAPVSTYLALSDLFVPVKILGPFLGILPCHLRIIWGSRELVWCYTPPGRTIAQKSSRESRRSGRRANRGTHSGWQRNSRGRVHQAELRGEKDRLKLLLDLNNSMVSKLELRELLRVISANVRRVMQCDSVGVNLPDPETGELRLYALDFPAAKGFLREGMVRPSGSLPARVFSTGQPAAFGPRAMGNTNADVRLYEEEGLQSSCWLPLISHDRALGVLGLSRLAATPFLPNEIHFLMQVSSQVAIAVENALAYGQISELTDKLAQEKLYLEDEIRTEANFEEIVGTSPALQRVLKLVETVAPTDSTVLICGETGTGKELIARAIHDLSPRNSKTFVRLNCAALPAGLLESELFGHEKGAFTGAVAQRIGRLELADHGTLFLDEVGEIPLELQPKLLRVLQEREFERLGGTRTIRIDVRLIAATNRDLAVMVQEQTFRSDLFFSLNVFTVELPPLRERPEDIPLLVRHFAEEFSRRMNRPVETISSETMNALCHYRWPGNIRELQNVIERSVILSSGLSLNVPVAELHSLDARASQ